jgi:hypothetical protein
MTASRETEVSQLARELRDAREQLTTTSEILEVIRNSLNDTQPVFDAIVQSGARLFPGAAVSIALVENGMVKAAAVAERDPVRAELWRRLFEAERAARRAATDVPLSSQKPIAGHPLGRCMAPGRTTPLRNASGWH